jgi:tetratricopeptide (TPR) repeat protein
MYQARGVKMGICLAVAAVAAIGCRTSGEPWTKQREHKTADGVPYVKTTLAAVSKNGTAWLDKAVQFDALLAGSANAYEPGTAFHPNDHLNFGVWDPDAQLWDQKDREAKAFDKLFVSRTDNDLTTRIQSYQAFQLVKVYGRVVMERHQMPLIQVDFMDPGEGGYTKMSIQNIQSARSAQAKGEYMQATRAFQDALKGPMLPTTGLKVVYREMGESFYKLALSEKNEKTAQGNFTSAQAFLVKAIEYDRTNGALYLRLGQTQMRLRNYPAAVQNLRSCVELEPKNWEAHANYGLALGMTGEYTEGLNECESALKKSWRDRDVVYHFRGQIYEQMGRFADAVKEYEQAIKAAQWLDAHHRRALIYLYYRQGIAERDDRQALELLKNALTPPFGIDALLKIKEEEANPANYHDRGDIYKAMGRRGDGKGYENALQSYQDAIDRDKTYLPAYVERAKVFVAMNKKEDAMKEMVRAAAAMGDKAPSAAVVIGQAHEELGNFEAAAAEYRKARDDDQRLLDAWLGLGRVSLKQPKADYTAANEAYAQALDVSQDNMEAQLALAYTSTVLGRMEEAGKLFVALNQSSPGNADVLKQYALYLKAAGNYDAASDTYGKLREITPKDSSFGAELAWLIARVSVDPAHLRWAEELAADAYKADKSASRAGVVGYVLLRAGKYEQAVKRLEKAEAAPSPWPLLALGEAKLQLDQIDDAAKRLDAAGAAYAAIKDSKQSCVENNLLGYMGTDFEAQLAALKARASEQIRVRAERQRVETAPVVK